MSSTEGSPPGAPMMKQFFDEELMPLARQLREKRSELLLKGVDPALETYYVRRVKRTMSKEDFENASCANGKEFAARLVAHWRSIGGEPLCELGGKSRADRGCRSGCGTRQCGCFAIHLCHVLSPDHSVMP